MVGKKLLHLTSENSVTAGAGRILFVALTVIILAPMAYAELGN